MFLSGITNDRKMSNFKAEMPILRRRPMDEVKAINPNHKVYLYLGLDLIIIFYKVITTSSIINNLVFKS